MSSKIIIFNVCGKLFTLHIDRLERVVPDSLLTKLATTDLSVDRDKDGNIFLDLNPEIFHHVWQYILLDGNVTDMCRCISFRGKALTGREYTDYQSGVEYLKYVVRQKDDKSKLIGVPLQKMMAFLNIECPSFGFLDGYYKWKTIVTHIPKYQVIHNELKHR